MFAIDGQAITIIVPLAGLMLVYMRLSKKQFDALKEQTNQRFDGFSERFDRFEKHTDQRFDKLEAEITEVKAGIVRIDERVYDLAAGRRTR